MTSNPEVRAVIIVGWMLASPALAQGGAVERGIDLSTPSAQHDGEQGESDTTFFRKLAGSWGLYGASVGTLLEDGRDYIVAGVEVSFAHVLENGLWYGWMVEFRFDERSRLGLGAGLEAGYGPLLIEAGPYIRFPDHASLGFRGRGCLSAGGAVSICIGGVVASRNQRFVEFAIVLKYPRRRGPATHATSGASDR